MKLIAYKEPDSQSVIDQLPMHRDWMDNTFDKHAYQCFPISMANRIGWGVSFKEDISFIWNGINDSNSSNVKIIKGEHLGVGPQRGNATVSFATGITISPDENISLLIMPPPNFFIDGVQCITTLISSSALLGPIPTAMMITKKNEEITIPAGTPIASILPISLNYINSLELNIHNGHPPREEEWHERVSKRSEKSMELNSRGEWTHFYRNAVDADGNPMGEHEAKKILMKVSYEQD